MSKSKLSEYAFQQKVLRFIKKHNIYCVKTIRTNQNGTPDLLLCINGRFIGLELKRDGEKPTKLQFHRLKEIEQSGGLGLWTRPDTWEDTKLILLKLLSYDKSSPES